MEDFSKLTPEQIDNLEAERDFTVDDDSASSSTTPNLSEVPASDGHAAVKKEPSQKDFLPAQPDGFILEPINQTGLPPHPHQAAKSPVGGSNVNPKASPPSIDSQLAALDEQSRRTTADRLRRLGYEADWHVMSELQMLEIEARITTANRLKQLGYEAEWQKETELGMLDIESRITTANRLRKLGYLADWHKETTIDMLDIESRISTANRLKAKGITVNWRTRSASQLLEMEGRY